MIQAVQSFYLAKRSMHYFSDLLEADDRVGMAIGNINKRLLRLAVLDIAGLNDGGLATKDPGDSRTASLPAVHRRMMGRLTDAKASAAEVASLLALQADINPGRHAPLLYVRHLRNKWAGHPSLDRRFDAWASADKELSLAAVEAALARLVNNTHDTAEFASSVPALQDFLQPRAVPNSDGSIPMDFDLSSVILLAGLMRDSAGYEARALRAQITGASRFERSAHTEAYAPE
ncbi:hypothetical protein [Plantibacter sp. VKM Ac-2876]|uniref:hypothetical protein n=1 Tax=Plantibacter sp. VKM Ac-2876 TaxID=2783826 RepID=UPI00188CA9C3|nr:hypothetical protein [Plantibacter sp. VKM Ac-2876]MBF4566586.1 hypothetical protein [Plantibacter sp. VKM Ac-2876]